MALQPSERSRRGHAGTAGRLLQPAAKNSTASTVAIRILAKQRALRHTQNFDSDESRSSNAAMQPSRIEALLDDVRLMMQATSVID